MNRSTSLATSDTEKSYQPFWFDDALGIEQPERTAPLGGETSADICIVGGGYTGLWTAIKIKQQAPEKDVVIIEAGLCGEGASGRNGGCMLTWSTKFPTLIRLYGLEQAVKLVNASEQAVWQLRDFCQQQGIDAEVRVDGAYYTATNPAQQGLLDPVLKLLEQQKINRWQTTESAELAAVTGSALNLSGIFTPNAGSLHPGKLVRGLRRIARKMGVRVYEKSPMTDLLPGNTHQVKTALGLVKCSKVVMATNSWMARQLPIFKRSLLLVSSDMIITKPIPETLAEIGLAHGASVIDSRTFVHYYRTTEDGRLMLGKGGNTFAFANRMLPVFDQASPYEIKLKRTLDRFFPAEDMPIERSWNGASDRSVSGFPFFGELPDQKNIFYGLGYSGNGVVQTFLGGEILAALVLGLDNDWSNCALVNAPVQRFPAEPIRYLGANMVRNAIRRNELAEDMSLIPKPWDIKLARFAGNAGKADKI